MFRRTSLRPLLFFGALAFWSTFSSSSNDPSDAVAVETANGAAPESPEDAKSPSPEVPKPEVEISSLPLALRAEVGARLVRPADIPQPCRVRPLWPAEVGATPYAATRLSLLAARDRCRTTDVRFIARSDQAHSPPLAA